MKCPICGFSMVKVEGSIHTYYRCGLCKTWLWREKDYTFIKRDTWEEAKILEKSGEGE